MKFMNYGKMAATFVNFKTGRAVRVIAKEDAASSLYRGIAILTKGFLQVDAKEVREIFDIIN